MMAESSGVVNGKGTKAMSTGMIVPILASLCSPYLEKSYQVPRKEVKENQIYMMYSVAFGLVEAHQTRFLFYSS